MSQRKRVNKRSAKLSEGTRSRDRGRGSRARLMTAAFEQESAALCHVTQSFDDAGASMNGIFYDGTYQENSLTSLVFIVCGQSTGSSLKEALCTVVPPGCASRISRSCWLSCLPYAITMQHTATEQRHIPPQLDRFSETSRTIF